MHKLVVLYPKPTDADHFRSYYESTHAPLALKFPGLRGFRWAADVQSIGSESPYFAIAECDFDDERAMMDALRSPEGKAAAADVQNYATGGATFLHYDFDR
ncbi:MAG: EthD family reductase [Dehalococcoidia bacterium]|nr:EthD family reductase [Dehalococcoidia bacterium]